MREREKEKRETLNEKSKKKISAEIKKRRRDVPSSDPDWVDCRGDADVATSVG
jgi:hypothetical protein